MDEELQVSRRDNGVGAYELVFTAPDGSQMVFGHGALFEKNSGLAVEIWSPDGKVDEKPKAEK